MKNEVLTKQFYMVEPDMVDEVGLEAAYLFAYLDGASLITSDKFREGDLLYCRFSDEFITIGSKCKWDSRKIKKLIDILKSTGYITTKTVNKNRRYVAITSKQARLKNVAPVIWEVPEKF